MRLLVFMISLLLAACENSTRPENDQVGGQPSPSKPGPSGEPMAAADSLTSQTDRDAIRDQIERCWKIPDEARATKIPVVDIRVRFNLDGTLQTDPKIVISDRVTDPSYRRFAEAARRAVIRCAPFRLPNDKFANRDIVFHFDPRTFSNGSS
jgi:hypothetical protein